MFSLLDHCNPGVGDWRQDILHRSHPRHDQQQAGDPLNPDIERNGY